MNEKKILALLTDFGISGHFTGAMKGVILSIDPSLRIFDITHEIQPQNILEAAYTLYDTMGYWPANTLFVAVIDPGVGTQRRSLLVRTKNKQTIICPDNGVLTLISDFPGISEVRVIREEVDRLPGSGSFHTFHGRDVYAYNAARLASGQITFAEVGDQAGPGSIVLLPLKYPQIKDGNINGSIIKIERPFGNVCTNISGQLIKDAGIVYGDFVKYQMIGNGEKRLEGELPLVITFGGVAPRQPLAYIDSSGRLGFSVNQGNFSEEFRVDAGLNWEIIIRKD